MRCEQTFNVLSLCPKNTDSTACTNVNLLVLHRTVTAYTVCASIVHVLYLIRFIRTALAEPSSAPAVVGVPLGVTLVRPRCLSAGAVRGLRALEVRRVTSSVASWDEVVSRGDESALKAVQRVGKLLQIHRTKTTTSEDQQVYSVFRHAKRQSSDYWSCDTFARLYWSQRNDCSGRRSRKKRKARNLLM